MRANLTRQGIRAAVAQHDTPALFDWLIEVVSYQGISDSIAWAYMEEHGRVTWADIDSAFARRPSCPKLVNFEAFSGCNYRKGSRTCAQPRPPRSLPASHRTRSGRAALNQAAYALYLFLRDECRGDLVTWIDGRLAEADLVRLTAPQADAKPSCVSGRCTASGQRSSRWPSPGSCWGPTRSASAG